MHIFMVLCLFQCIPVSHQCDGINHCVDASDERQCDTKESVVQINEVYPPAIVDFNKFGSFTLRPMDRDQDGEFPSCPETHFRCAGNGYCLPVFVVCNDVYDCPGHEDEAGCDDFDCPGFYRCRSSRVCLHPSYVCDMENHCPLRDDELNCEAVCPRDCTCYGAIFFCHNYFAVDLYPNSRYLDASSTNITLKDLHNNTMLIYLKLARCHLSRLSVVSLFNLRTLDLSDNHIQSIDVYFFQSLRNLRELSLSNNPLQTVFVQQGLSQWSHPHLRVLSLAQVPMLQSSLKVLEMFPDLHQLNLSHNNIDVLRVDEFQVLEHLQVLDLRGNPATFFSHDIFLGFKSLRTVLADNYKLCCPSLLPSGFNLANCKAPSNELSSCEALLQSSVYRGFLSLFAFLSLTGNLVSFVYRSVANRGKRKIGFDIFVANLCVSDFLMGIYLSIIGVADLIYRGYYLSRDVIWRFSLPCKAAGFLSLVSSEVSVFIICLITLDRFLVLQFPFSHLHFTTRRALLASVCAWLVGTLMAMVPLLPWTSHWHFYSQNGICVPLPITRNDYPGQLYSFSIMIVFNFVLFLAIALGQLFIYWSVQKNTMRSGSKNDTSAKDISIAQRLIAVALSDFLCWFPVGLLGILAMSGQPISGEVNVAIAVFILPVNSAINPFVYTINVILTNRQKRREERMKQMLKNQLADEANDVNAGRYQDLKSELALRAVKRYLSRGILSKENISFLLQDHDGTPVSFTSDQALLLLKQMLAKDILKAEQVMECTRAAQSSVIQAPVNFEDSGH